MANTLTQSEKDFMRQVMGASRLGADKTLVEILTTVLSEPASEFPDARTGLPAAHRHR